METRATAREVRLRQWAEIMRERTNSGQSISAWCESHGIRRQQYFYWQRKLREMACTELSAKESARETGLAPAGWARLEPPQHCSTESGVTIEINGCCVIATAQTDPELLAKLCCTLKSL